MAGLFGKPQSNPFTDSTPTPAPPPIPVQPDITGAEDAAAAQQRKAKGAAATVLTNQSRILAGLSQSPGSLTSGGAGYTGRSLLGS